MTKLSELPMKAMTSDLQHLRAQCGAMTYVMGYATRDKDGTVGIHYLRPFFRLKSARQEVKDMRRAEGAMRPFFVLDLTSGAFEWQR